MCAEGTEVPPRLPTLIGLLSSRLQRDGLFMWRWARISHGWNCPNGAGANRLNRGHGLFLALQTRNSDSTIGPEKGPCEFGVCCRVPEGKVNVSLGMSL